MTAAVGPANPPALEREVPPPARLAVVATAAAYFVAAAGSMLLTLNTNGFGTIWPASGILVAALLIARPGREPALLLGAGVASLAANLMAGVGAWNALIFTIANLMEAAIVARLCAHEGQPPDMTSPRQVGRLAAAVVAGGLASAAISTIVSGASNWRFFVSWFATVTLGMMIVTPLILTAWALLRGEARAQIGRRPAEIAALLALMALTGGLVFGQSVYPLLFLPMLVQIGVTYRLGPFGAAAGVVIVAAIGSIAAACGAGPLVTLGPSGVGTLLFLQLYLLALLASALPLATLLAKREDLMRQLRLAHAEAARTATLATAAADTDDLTGLASRRCILIALNAALTCGMERGPLAVALVDVDHFKAVNDRYGHATGDLVLRRVGGAVVSALRSADRVGRFGGEEFLLVLQGADAPTALAIADRVRRAVETRPRGADEPGVTISIGFAMAEPGDDADTLIDRADRALYAAKAAGRNRVLAAAA